MPDADAPGVAAAEEGAEEGAAPAQPAAGEEATAGAPSDGDQHQRADEDLPPKALSASVVSLGARDGAQGGDAQQVCDDKGGGDAPLDGDPAAKGDAGQGQGGGEEVVLTAPPTAPATSGDHPRQEGVDPQCDALPCAATRGDGDVPADAAEGGEGTPAATAAATVGDEEDGAAAATAAATVDEEEGAAAAATAAATVGDEEGGATLAQEDAEVHAKDADVDASPIATQDPAGDDNDGACAVAVPAAEPSGDAAAAARAGAPAEGVPESKDALQDGGAVRTTRSRAAAAAAAAAATTGTMDAALAQTSEKHERPLRRLRSSTSTRHPDGGGKPVPDTKGGTLTVGLNGAGDATAVDAGAAAAECDTSIEGAAAEEITPCAIEEIAAPE